MGFSITSTHSQCLMDGCRAEELYTEIERLRAALEFYANPETYFAIVVFGDAPCGAFIDDYSDDHGHPQLDGPRYGKRAREALNQQKQE